MRNETFAKIFITVVCIFVQLTYGATVFLDDFQSSAWDTAASGLPDSGQIKPVDASSGLPDSWEFFKGDTNGTSEQVHLVNGVNQRGATLADTTDTAWLSMTEKRGVQVNLSAFGVTSSDTIIVSFDWSSMDPIDWSGNIDYAVLDGPVDTAAGSPNVSNAFSSYDLDNSFGSVTNPGTPDSGTVSFEVNLIGATSDIYLAFFYDNWGNKGPVIDNVTVEKLVSAESLSPDFDNSGRVDLLDFQEFSDSWLDIGAIPENLDGVGIVDLADLSIFSSWWLRSLIPEALPDAYTVGKNGALILSADDGLLSNDSDPESLPLKAVLVSHPSNGLLVMRSDGSLTYEPTYNFVGNDSFSYQASNGSMKSSVVAVDIQVADKGNGFLNRDEFIVPTRTIEGMTGLLNYPDKPDKEFYVESFDVRMELFDRGDWFGYRTYGYVIPPETGDYTFYQYAKNPVELYLSTDSNPANKVLIIDGYNSSLPGKASLARPLQAGQRYYIESRFINEYYEAWLELRWESTNGGVAQTKIEGEAISSFYEIAAQDDSYRVARDQTLLVEAEEGLLINDELTQPTIQCAELSVVAAPTLGSLDLNSDGSFVYTPNTGLTGVDSFRYRLTHRGTSVESDVTLDIQARHPMEADLFDDLLGYWPFNGNLTDQSDYHLNTSSVGSLSYTPGKVSQGLVLDSTTEGVNFGSIPLELDWTISLWVKRTSAASPRSLLGSDSYDLLLEKDASEKLGTTQGTFDSVTPLNQWVHLCFKSSTKYNDARHPDQVHLYVNGQYVGHVTGDEFSLDRIGNAASSQTPSVQLDELVVWNRRLSEEEHQFVYSLGDAGLAIPWNTSVSNYPPTARPDAYSVNTNTATTLDVLANDRDVEGDSLTLSLASGASNGNVIKNGNSNFTYTSNSGFTGIDSFTYTISDASASSYPETVTLEVFDNALQPGTVIREIWNNISGTAITDLTSDPDYPDNPDSVEVLTSVQTSSSSKQQFGERIRGFLHPPQTGIYKFGRTTTTPVELLISTDESPENLIFMMNQSTDLVRRDFATVYLDGDKKYYFEYLHKVDGSDTGYALKWRQCARGDQLLTEAVIGSDYISQPNAQTAPIVSNLSHTVFAGTPLTVPAPGLQAGTLDAECDALTYSLVSNGAKGTATVSPDGSYSYTPNMGATGADSFTFKANDGHADSAAGTVAIEIITSTNANAGFTNWNYGPSQDVQMVACAEFSGYYACADRVSDTVEVRDIRGDVIHLITPEMIQETVPLVDLSGDSYGVSSIAFSVSGRMLYIGLCGAPGSSASPNDAILQYNTNTRDLRLFTRLEMASSLSGASNLGLLHFCGKLYVGTETGLLVYEATRNVKYAHKPSEILVPASGSQTVLGLALDIYDERVYMITSDRLYRLNVKTPYWIETPGNVQYLNDKPMILEEVGSFSGLNALTMGRSYGGSTNAGLYIQQRLSSSLSRLYHVSLSHLRLHADLGLSGYTEIAGDLKAIAGTPCGRMLLATPTAQLMSDQTDARLTFEDWLTEYFADSQAHCLEGLSANAEFSGARQGPEHFGWDFWDGYAHASFGQLTKLLVYYEVLQDPLVASAIEEMLSFAADNFVVNANGIFALKYQRSNPSNIKNGRWNPNQSGKALYPIAGAKERFPNNSTIQASCEKILSSLYRLGDNCSALGLMAEGASHWGPAGDTTFWDSEIHAGSGLYAALDPYWTLEYEMALTRPDDIRQSPYPRWIHYSVSHQPQFLDGEEAFFTDRKNYQWAFHWLTQERYYTDPEWIAQFYNQIYKYCAWGDDNRNPYPSIFGWFTLPDISGQERKLLGGFSMGGVFDPPLLETSQLRDLEQWCSFGDTWPAVAMYLAYREGRQDRHGDGVGYDNLTYTGVEQLNHYCRFVPQWTTQPTDVIGVIGLAELIQPGSLKASEAFHRFYRSEVEVGNNSGKVQLKFSEITPRRVLASNNEVDWVDYGYQKSPFTLDSGVSYNHYKVEDPEGQHLMMVMDNVDFEDDLAGWTPVTDSGVSVTAAGSGGISGKGAKILATSSAGSSYEGSLYQTVDLNKDFDLTQYRLRGTARVIASNGNFTAYLRAQWDTDTSIGNGVTNTAMSNSLAQSGSFGSFVLDTEKPAGSDYVHLSFVLDGSSVPTGDCAIIVDNLSLVRIGAPVSAGNLDFEQGSLSGWTVSDGAGMISVTNDVGDVLDGSYAMKVSSNTGDQGLISTITLNLDVSADATGTRYMLHAMPKSFNQESTLCTMQLKYYDTDTSNFSWLRRKALEVEPYCDGEKHVVTVVKSPDMGQIQFIFEVRRYNYSSSDDKMIIDGMKLYKETMWPLPDNFIGLP